MTAKTRRIIESSAGSAEPDRAMALFGNAVERIRLLEAPPKHRIGRERCCIHLGHQLHQGAVGRHFGPVHRRHRRRKGGTDIVR